MKVKFNKELLLKHRFWIMLGVAAALTLTSIAYLEFLYAGPIETTKKILGEISKAKTKKGTQNQATIEAMEKLANESIKRETDLWQKAYLEQRDLYKWADPVEAKFDFYNGTFAVKIELAKLPPDVKSWPADNPNLIHGTNPRFTEDGFILKTRKGDVTVNLTDFVSKVQTDDGKSIPYGQVNDVYCKDKLLAVTFQTGRYFYDALTIPEQRTFTNSYKDQIHEILKLVNPLDENLNGVVQLREWLYKPAPEFPGPDKKFIRYVDAEWGANKSISREAWIAQENLWIQKEIYRMISVANKELSNFVGKGGKERNKAYTFKNPNFEVSLNLDAKGALTFQIRNLLDRQQNIDMKFRVLLSDTPGIAPETITISGLPLKPKGDKDGKDVHPQTIPVEKTVRNAVVSVQQVLTWQTAAVKRIDQVSIGSNGGEDELSHSHRTYVEPLLPFSEKDMIVVQKDAEGKIIPPAPVFPGGGREGKFGPGGFKGGKFGPKFGAVGAVGANEGLIEQGLWTYRYVEVTPQSRRLPVAVALIVDQDHIDRVLTSFNNSKLRFLPTQVLLNQYMGSLQPPAIEMKNAPGAPGFPAFPMFPPGGFGPREAFGPGAFGGGQPNDPNAAGGQETNIELVIYGIMTLYQRYPAAPLTPGMTEGEKK